MRFLGFFLLFFGLLVLIHEDWSYAKSYTVQVLRKKTKSQRVPRLLWEKNNFEIQVKGSGLNTQVVATLRGRHEDLHSGLVYRGLKIRKDAQGNFRLTVPVWGVYSQVILSSVTPEGRAVHERFILYFKDWAEFKADYVRKRLNFNVGLGLTYLTFQQTGVEDFSEFTTTAKISAFYLLVPGVLDVGLNTFFNVFPVTSSKSGFSLRFWGINGRIGYVLPFIDRPWRVTLMAGLYWVTTFLTAPSGTPDSLLFGFKGLSGPQFFPMVMRYLDNGDVLMSYFKFSPVGSGFSLISLGNHEVAGGFGWIHPTKKGGVWSYHLDVSKIDLEFPSRSTNISSMSISLSAAYGF